VEEIALQSNLLALNAAIEATRTGQLIARYGLTNNANIGGYKYGTGDATTTVGGLLENDWNESDSNKWLVFLFDNPNAEVVDFDAAIDNIRVVKIKNGN
jgi:hypothetical protein